MEVSTVAEIYTEPKEFKRYALVPAPPKWELQEYIAAYLKEKDDKYLAWFLHYYENTLNTNVQKYMKHKTLDDMLQEWSEASQFILVMNTWFERLMADQCDEIKE